MDRKNGGDPLAAVPPPRPPKSLPRVHRPRAPEPTLSQGVINSNNNSSSSTSNTINTSSNRSRTNPILPPLIALHNNSNITTTNNNNLNRNNSNLSSSFSRRRPPPPSTILIPIPLTPTTIQPIINNNLLTPTTTATATTTTTTPVGLGNFQNIGSPNSPVTLASPRPETERLANEYVDTPLQRQNPNTPHNNNNNQHGFLHTGQRHILQQIHQQHSTTANHLLQSSHLSSTTPNAQTAASTTTATPTTTITITDDVDCESNTELIHSNNTLSPKETHIKNLLQKSRPITKQPTATSSPVTTSTTFVKDVGPTISPLCHDDHGDSTNLITCPQCKRCRCDQCKKPRQLPSTWICNKSCLCSAESVIDYASCLCCVKALFFHSESMKDGADDPCSCAPYRRTARWGWLGALSILLPCLWCYWPMRGCIALCAKCYRRYAQQGCRCQQTLPNILQANNSSSIGGVGVNNIINSNSNFSGEKRLLDTN